MGWCPHPRFHNEHMFLGPHRLFATLQQEMNVMGRQAQPWSVHGWEWRNDGYIALMVRSIEVDPVEDA